MATVAQEITTVAPGIYLWQAFDPAVRTELFSTALKRPDGLFVIDPIPVEAEALTELLAHGSVAAVAVTNENHERSAADFARQFEAPVYVQAAIAHSIAVPDPIGVTPARGIGSGLTTIFLDGAPLGEMAIYCPDDNGTMVIGDALINSEPYGFSLLPAKYCRDLKAMRQSLRGLLDYEFERILFAHGIPIMTKARSRLEQLLNTVR